MIKIKIKEEKHPQEFLSRFTSLEDKKYIQKIREEFLHKLYCISINTTDSLRKRLSEIEICLGPSPVRDETDYETLMDCLNIQLAILSTLKQLGIIKIYNLKKDYDKLINKALPPELMIFTNIEFYPLNVISYYENFNKHTSKTVLKLDEPIFDGINGTIQFGSIIYSFQKGGINQNRWNIFKKLWDSRKIIKNGKIEKEGEIFPPETVAVRLGIVDSAQSFFREYNKEKKEKFNLFIKNINTNLKRKKMPIKISKKNGIQILIKL